jgi:hypothetical protein
LTIFTKGGVSVPIGAAAWVMGDGGVHARVGAFEAENKPEVARLVPVRSIWGREEARAAPRRIRERTEPSKLGRFDWTESKSYRDENRS